LKLLRKVSNHSVPGKKMLTFVPDKITDLVLTMIIYPCNIASLPLNNYRNEIILIKKQVLWKKGLNIVIKELEL